jgi:hypothetical protein
MEKMNSHNLIRSIFCAMMASTTICTVALGQNTPAAYDMLVDDRAVPSPSISETISDRPCGPRWTTSADFIIFERVGGVHRTLVETVPHTVPLDDLPTTPGTEVFNVNDFHQGFSGGPRIGLTRRGDCGYDWELSFFQIDGWNSERTIGPAPDDWLIMRGPGVFLQTQESTEQTMVFNYASKLYNAELNVRWHPLDRLSVLAGIRWLNLSESFQGALEPPTIVGEPPFWNSSTTNNLFGFQIGAAGTIFERGRFSIDGLAKTGLYDDSAEASTGISTFKVVRPAAASTHHAAFVAEIGLQCKYRIAKSLSLKAGYQAIWLEGVALAPGQIQVTPMPTPITAIATGVNCDSGVFYHGANAGLEYSF